MKSAVTLVAAFGLAILPWASAHSSPRANSDLLIRARLLVDGVTVQSDQSQPVKIGNETPVKVPKSAVRAMVLSAILPGLGEVYASGTRGYVTGSAMAAADVFSFWQYIASSRKGDDRKQQYRQFAAVHYLRDRLNAYARDTIAVYSGSDSLGFCRPGSTHDEEKCTQQIDRHFPISQQNDNDFYQQVASDDYFIFGWDDWNMSDTQYPEFGWTGWNPGAHIPDMFVRDKTGATRSQNRAAFAAMRQRADDAYGRAQTFAWVMVIGRIVSMVDSAILVKFRNRDLAGLGQNPRLCFTVRPGVRPDMKLALKVRF